MFTIQASNLFFSYTGSSPHVLDGISLEISDGDYVSVVGENGCGKSTLMRLVLEFIKPTGGVVGLKAKRIRYIPRKNGFSSTNFPITVPKILYPYYKLLKVKGKSVIMFGITQVGINGFESVLVGTFSDGQEQKILIARVLLGNPGLLVLDGPSTGMDMEGQKEIYRLLKKLNREKGITIVSVEHNLNAAIANSMFLYHLVVGRGRLCTPEQYIKEYLHEGKKGRSDTRL